MYSDGITEAEDAFERPFDEAGVQSVVDGPDWASAKELGWAHVRRGRDPPPGAAAARRSDDPRRAAPPAAAGVPRRGLIGV